MELSTSLQRATSTCRIEGGYGVTVWLRL
jgi:hypothetical protein